MKRFLSILAILCLVFTFAHAESFDLASMTTDDLFALRKKIDAEIQSRYPNSPIIGQGSYIAGKDIKVGSYILVCDENYKENNICVSIYSKTESAKYIYTTAGSVVTVILKEGDELKITNTFFYISPASEFWMP